VIKGIHHVATAVADLGAAEAFYAQAAGLAPSPSGEAGLPAPPGGGASRMLAGPNGRLRLLEAPSAAGAVPVWEAGITHFCLQGVAPDALRARFESAGASFHSDLVDLGTGYLYCYARDPEGNVIELEGVAPAWTDPQPWFAHVAISTASIGALADFYGNVLGNAPIRSPRFRNNRRLDRIAGGKDIDVEAAWIPSTNMQVELMQYFHPPTIHHPDGGARAGLGYRYIALEVDDPVHELGRLLALGGASPRGLPRDGERHAWCADPEGNLLLLLAPTNGADSIAALPDPQIAMRHQASSRRIQQERPT
jgi:catechol 2,3-dioxygenase-like lactoylglutathione lyase family enzyme